MIIYKNISIKKISFELIYKISIFLVLTFYTFIYIFTWYEYMEFSDWNENQIKNNNSNFDLRNFFIKKHQNPVFSILKINLIISFKKESISYKKKNVENKTTKLKIKKHRFYFWKFLN